MNKKREIIDYINSTKDAHLNNSNVCFSKINKSKLVWWLNVPVSKFVEDVNLLLKTENQVIWVLLPKGFAIGVPFKIREDINTVDLEISADKQFMYLQDLKSGGEEFNFKPFVKETINF